MRNLLVILSVLIFATGLAVASDQTDVMGVVQKFVDGFNKGDVKSALATCADEAYIIDEFAPYEWHGTGACSSWANAFDADAKKNGITDPIVTLGKPRHVDIIGDRAYVVAPANYSFKQKGKPMKETGSTFTLVLQKQSADWRITSWAWAKQ